MVSFSSVNDEITKFHDSWHEINIFKSIRVNLTQLKYYVVMIPVVNLILMVMDEKENITYVIKKNTLNMKEIVTKLENIIRSNGYKQKYSFYS